MSREITAACNIRNIRTYERAGFSVRGTAQRLGLRASVYSFFQLFTKLYPPGDSEVTFAVFQSSCHLLLPV